MGVYHMHWWEACPVGLTMRLLEEGRYQHIHNMS